MAVETNPWTIPYPGSNACEQDPDGILETLEEYFLNSPPQRSPEPPPERPQEPSAWRELRALGVKVGVIAGIALLLFTFVYGLHYNLEPGMNPSVKDGDLVIFYRLDKSYHAGDLALLAFQGKKQVRRVVAAAGDTVDITEEGLVINGALQQEPGISQKTHRYAEGISFPLTLGENQVFVLGDARENAADSRIYGPVNVSDTQGAVITVLRRRNL
ncbi:MAG: signal peptidase I [Oscillospiraceae bacterium]|nr:signal peptidase I [Oscillospiraceae bacterium]